MAARLFQWLALKLGDWWFHSDVPPPKKVSGLRAKAAFRKARIEECKREIARMKELKRDR